MCDLVSQHEWLLYVCAAAIKGCKPQGSNSNRATPLSGWADWPCRIHPFATCIVSYGTIASYGTSATMQLMPTTHMQKNTCQRLCATARCCSTWPSAPRRLTTELPSYACLAHFQVASLMASLTRQSHSCKMCGNRPYHAASSNDGHFLTSSTADAACPCLVA